MSRADKRAETERGNAIIETSEKVSAAVSEKVTKAVTEQYAGMVSDQKSQIADLKTQLVAQGKKVDVISGSNIVTGKKPVKVELINPSEQLPALPNLNWQQLPVADHKERIAVILRVTDELKSPAFVAACDRPCSTQEAHVTGASMILPLQVSSDKTVTGIFLSQPNPLPSGMDVTWVIESSDGKSPVNIQKIRIVSKAELPETLK